MRKFEFQGSLSPASAGVAFAPRSAPRGSQVVGFADWSYDFDGHDGASGETRRLGFRVPWGELLTGLAVGTMLSALSVLVSIRQSKPGSPAVAMLSAGAPLSSERSEAPPRPAQSDLPSAQAAIDRPEPEAKRPVFVPNPAPPILAIDPTPANLKSPQRLKFISSPLPPVAALLGTVPVDLPTPDQPVLKPRPAAVISQPKPTAYTLPAYPDRALDKKVEGYVDFDFTIERDGSVGNLKAVAESPSGYGFKDSALKVFPTWKFAAGSADDGPRPAHYRLTYKVK